MAYIISVFLWTIGGLTFFIFSVLLLLLTFILPYPKYDPFLKWICRFVLNVLFIRVKVEGLENIDRDKTYLFIANHVNIFDIIVFGGYIPHTIRGVELESHFRWPLYGALIRRTGNIPISQSRPFEAMKSLENTRQILNSGTSIILLPEGHRTLDGKLQKFSRAPFNMALNTSVDIVPMALVGAYNIKRKGSWLIHPGTITLRIDNAITFSSVQELDSHTLRDTVRERIIALLKQSR
jgi:1-acyl-sn-glycerol-3-phosphate acyltransferase